MKEISIEEKAKRYDEAWHKAQKWYNANTNEGYRGIFEDIFPELKESEDEGIRNFLIDFIKVCGWTEKKDQGWPLKEECIAWLEKQDGHAKFINGIQVGDKVTRNKDGVLVNLSQLNRVAKKDEKQGKQKPADKVEPKFKIGDFIVNDYCMGRIVEITNDAYLLDTEQGIPFSCHSTRLWDITKDAKDGDVLHSTGFYSDCVFIFNGLDNWKFDEPNGNRAVATGYCCITASADNIEFDIQGPDCIEVNSIKPATQIQRDLLFQKMKEAEYEWDAEKKELKKIEEKPAWSEEDEKNLNWFEKFFRAESVIAEGRDIPQDRYLWFKSLKDRVQPQPKQEWSEEDENTLEEVISILEYQKGYCSGKWHCVGEACPASKCIDKLKSIRPQLLWKPSDEQMDALESAVSLSQSTTLESLYNELKKL